MLPLKELDIYVVLVMQSRLLTQSLHNALYFGIPNPERAARLRVLLHRSTQRTTRRYTRRCALAVECGRPQWAG